MTPCRNCGDDLHIVFCDLGAQPLANAYLSEDQLEHPEITYPLRPMVCDNCQLVQLPSVVAPEHVFDDYHYFSSQSQEWLGHCDRYAGEISIRFGLGAESRVLEIASNDGGLLQCFRRRGIPAMGVEPAANVAWHAIERGLATITEFFGVELARRLRDDGYSADLIAANNVLAHVPDLEDFLTGVRLVLAPEGVATFEFPSVLTLVRDNHWDTIYHEHYSYLCLGTAEDALRRRGLRVFDATVLPTHGGSLRVYACKRSSRSHVRTQRVESLARSEHGVTARRARSAYGTRPPRERRAALRQLLALRENGHRIVGYGAPAKGNTFLNYLGLDSDTVEFVVDSTPAKQGKYLPGSRIPVRPPEELPEDAVVLVLPWNHRNEIAAKLPAETLVYSRPFSASDELVTTA